jgi:hypothetical protein
MSDRRMSEQAKASRVLCFFCIGGHTHNRLTRPHSTSALTLPIYLIYPSCLEYTDAKGTLYTIGSEHNVGDSARRPRKREEWIDTAWRKRGKRQSTFRLPDFVRMSGEVAGGEGVVPTRLIHVIDGGVGEVDKTDADTIVRCSKMCSKATRPAPKKSTSTEPNPLPPSTYIILSTLFAAAILPTTPWAWRWSTLK